MGKVKRRAVLAYSRALHPPDPHPPLSRACSPQGSFLRRRIQSTRCLTPPARSTLRRENRKNHPSLAPSATSCRTFPPLVGYRTRIRAVFHRVIFGGSLYKGIGRSERRSCVQTSLNKHGLPGRILRRENEKNRSHFPENCAGFLRNCVGRDTGKGKRQQK